MSTLCLYIFLNDIYSFIFSCITEDVKDDYSLLEESADDVDMKSPKRINPVDTEVEDVSIP